MLKVEVLKEALKTSHNECSEAKGGCIHAEALAACADDIVAVAALTTLEMGGSATLSLLSHAFHIGYRAHQLEQDQAIATAQMN